MILVVGATGLVGTEVCRQLAAAGQPVRALVRSSSDPAKVAALRALPAEVVEGDVRDHASLVRACMGVEAVVCTLSAMPFSYVPGANDIASVDLAGVMALIDAAQAAGARRFVDTSFSGGIDRTFPLRDAKREVEAHLKATTLDWTILRPSFFMEVWLSPAVGFDAANAAATIYGDGESPISWISLRDVARFAVACVTRDVARQTILELGGPRPIAPRDVVRVFETAMRRPFAMTFVPIEALDQQLAAATDPMAASFAGLMRSYADGDPIEMGKTMDLLDGPMTSVEQYAASQTPVGSEA